MEDRLGGEAPLDCPCSQVLSTRGSVSVQTLFMWGYDPWVRSCPAKNRKPWEDPLYEAADTPPSWALVSPQGSWVVSQGDGWGGQERTSTSSLRHGTRSNGFGQRSPVIFMPQRDRPGCSVNSVDGELKAGRRGVDLLGS